MVTKVLLDYLDNKNVYKHKKYLYLESLDLSYSDLFELMDIYKHDSKLSRNNKTKKMKRIRRESSYD